MSESPLCEDQLAMADQTSFSISQDHTTSVVACIATTLQSESTSIQQTVAQRALNTSDVLHGILELLPANTLAKCMQVNSTWRTISRKLMSLHLGPDFREPSSYHYRRRELCLADLANMNATPERRQEYAKHTLSLVVWRGDQHLFDFFGDNYGIDRFHGWTCMAGLDFPKVNTVTIQRAWDTPADVFWPSFLGYNLRSLTVQNVAGGLFLCAISEHCPLLSELVLGDEGSSFCQRDNSGLAAMIISCAFTLESLTIKCSSWSISKYPEDEVNCRALFLATANHPNLKTVADIPIRLAWVRELENVPGIFANMTQIWYSPYVSDAQPGSQLDYAQAMQLLLPLVQKLTGLELDAPGHSVRHLLQTNSKDIPSELVLNTWNTVPRSEIYRPNRMFRTLQNLKHLTKLNIHDFERVPEEAVTLSIFSRPVSWKLVEQLLNNLPLLKMLQMSSYWHGSEQGCCYGSQDRLYPMIEWTASAKGWTMLRIDSCDDPLNMQLGSGEQPFKTDYFGTCKYPKGSEEWNLCQQHSSYDSEVDIFDALHDFMEILSVDYTERSTNDEWRFDEVSED